MITALSKMGNRAADNRGAYLGNGIVDSDIRAFDLVDLLAELLTLRQQVLFDELKIGKLKELITSRAPVEPKDVTFDKPQLGDACW